jgi:hypothetical protein
MTEILALRLGSWHGGRARDPTAWCLPSSVTRHTRRPTPATPLEMLRDQACCHGWAR